MLYLRKASLTAALACLLGVAGSLLLASAGLPMSRAQALPIVIDDFGGGSLSPGHAQNLGTNSEYAIGTRGGGRSISVNFQQPSWTTLSPSADGYTITREAAVGGKAIIAASYGPFASTPATVFHSTDIHLAGHHDLVLTLRDVDIAADASVTFTMFLFRESGYPAKRVVNLADWQPGPRLDLVMPLSLFEGAIDLSSPITSLVARIDVSKGLKSVTLDHFAVMPEPGVGVLLGVAGVAMLARRR